MSESSHLLSVQKVVTSFKRIKTLNERQVAALRANLTKALAACKEADDKQMIDLLKSIEAKLPAKDKSSEVYQTVDDLVNEYVNEYRQKSGTQQAAFKAKLTRRANQAKAEGLTGDYHQLIALQARMEHDSEAIRRQFILAMMLESDLNLEEEE